MLEATVLGCGCSLGVPVVGCNCAICKSNNPFNKRQRSSILITDKINNTKVLIDSGPDIKNQLLQNNIDDIDAIILTHAHNDHIIGLDDIRIVSIKNGNKAIDLYANEQTMFRVLGMFNYLHLQKNINPILIKYYSEVSVGKIKLQTFKQHHHEQMNSTGIRINNFVYANDVISFPDESLKYLHNADAMLVDCKNYEDTDIHAGLGTVMKWNDIFKPKKMFLTDMSHKIDYDEVKSKIPENVQPCFDGMKILI